MENEDGQVVESETTDGTMNTTSLAATNVGPGITNASPAEESPPELLPSISSIKGGSGHNPSTGMMNKPTRPNIIQLPGNMLGKPSTTTTTSHPGTLHAPTPRIMSPTYHGPPGYSSMISSYQASNVAPQQQQQKMELHDAFAYLDRVKAEFAEQPDVYNRFLQIMREFKANAIDANGVIVRVVQLFKGHKTLIQGFNAFLPRTHHIDPMVAETGILPPHLMQVAASMGISLNAQGIPISLPSMTSTSSTTGTPQSGYPPQWSSDGVSGASQYYGQGAPQWNVRAPTQILQPSPAPLAAIAQAPTIAGFTPQAASSSSASGAPGTPNKKSSAQFVRAISYVKKIKHRFANEPDIYKTFLAALHSYHKEQKTIFEVYMEVANLFTEHPDLLEEFVLFLPENEAATITNRLSQAGIAPIGLKSSRVDASQKMNSSNPSLKRPAQAIPPPSKTSKRMRQATTMSTRSAEESAFYERVKRYLDDKTAYAEFLKCLNLFCQDIIRIGDLVLLVSRFIGSNEELFGWFKRYIGYKDPSSNGEGPLWKLGDTISNELVNDNGELNLAVCKKVGSYRIYPKAHSLPKSSHRTALGREVLNDSMVSCPVFNSEDSTFIASKKNIYEEALFRCEDERFELDLLIDHNLATIAVFEPLARKIEVMSPEERNTLTLGSNLGGTSTVIYKKTICKIYGEKADEVISGLMKNPAIAVPVVLRRLKQKDEEWRRAQRDWNKIWRDTHLKNYYKALDHQGIEFKANDRKNITGRTLIMEIESIAAERRRAMERGEKIETFVPYHLEFNCGNPSKIAEDLFLLIRALVRGSVASLSKNDRKAILKFISSFLPDFFAFSSTLRADQGREKITVSSTKSTVTHDLSSDGSSDDCMSDSEVSGSLSMKADASNSEPPTAVIVNSFSQQSSVLLFANANLYILVRLLQMSMDRLEKLQTASKVANGSPFFTEKRNVVASFLDLQSQADAGVEMSDGNSDFYATLLVLLRQLVSGNLDGSVFEERVRFMFGTAAYPIFTLDKLIQTIVKQIQIILSDPICEQLVRLFDSWNSRRNNMRLSEYSARMAVESSLPGKEPIFRIEYHPKTGKLTIQQLDRLSSDSGAAASAESKWSAYVDNFVKLESNPRYLGKTKVYLNRCRLPQGVIARSSTNILVQYNLECKIAINTYKLFYVENTEDFLYRYRAEHRGRISTVCNARFQKWLQSIWH